jgi:SAM-dependent methyltransferase
MKKAWQGYHPRTLMKELPGNDKWKEPLRRFRKRVLQPILFGGALSQSWKSDRVAEAQQNLVEKELADPLAIPPFKAFIEIIAYIADHYGESVRTFLDVGCGVGHYSELLNRYFAGRFLYTGSDYSESMVARARSLRGHSSFIADDILNSRLDLRSYDVVFASALVDVLHNWKRALKVLFHGTSRLLILHRQRVTDGASYSEVAPGHSNQTFSTCLNQRELERMLARAGLRLKKQFIVAGNIHSFLAERK